MCTVFGSFCTSKTKAISGISDPNLNEHNPNFNYNKIYWSALFLWTFPRVIVPMADQQSISMWARCVPRSDNLAGLRNRFVQVLIDFFYWFSHMWLFYNGSTDILLYGPVKKQYPRKITFHFPALGKVAADRHSSVKQAGNDINTEQHILFFLWHCFLNRLKTASCQQCHTLDKWFTNYH